MDPEIKRVEAYYTSMIQTKQVMLASYDAQILEGTDQELQQLESMYNDLSQKWLKTGDKEKVKAAMIRNLKIRVQLLNQQIELLERINDAKQVGDAISI